MKKIIVISSVLLAAAATSHAATLTLLNGDFEGGNNGTPDFDPASWTVTEAVAGNIYAVAGVSPFTSNVLHIKDNTDASFSSIAQNLSANNAGLTAGSYNNYTVTLDLGWRSDRISGGAATGDATLRFELYSISTPTTVYGSTNFTLVQRATPLFNIYELIHDDLTINIASTGSGTDAIGLRILRIDPDNTAVEGNSTLWMDNLSVTAVPEPSAALLGGLGVLALLRRRRA